jgi:hypothetical protein
MRKVDFNQVTGAGQKNNEKRDSGECLFSFSASLQWLCPSTKEEEEVI